MSDTGQEAGGLFATFRRLLDTGLAAVQNRLELFAVELREEKCRLLEMLLCAAAAFFFGILAVLTVTVTVVVLFQEYAKLLLAGFSLLYICGAIVSFWLLKKRLKCKPTPFADSIAELKKDREWLQPRK